MFDEFNLYLVEILLFSMIDIVRLKFLNLKILTYQPDLKKYWKLDVFLICDQIVIYICNQLMR